MQNRRPLLSYILVNIVISALTTLAVLLIWNRMTAIPDRPISDQDNSPPTISDDASNQSNFADQLKITTVIAPGDLQNERVLLEHIGDEDVLLAGWVLEDEDGHNFAFPALVLHPGAALEIHSQDGENTVTRLYWNESDSIWSRSETATLLDPNNESQASYQIP
jgi:hypothetical protein